MTNLDDIRQQITAAYHADDADIISELQAQAGLSIETRHRISNRALQLVKDIRQSADSGLMEVFLAEYGLSTDEGVALMCLAEALLRVPDEDTIDALIEDKIAPSSWGSHLGKSSSSLVNASTWALMLTGKVLKEEEDNGIAHLLKGAIKRLGEPVIRSAVKAAMKELGQQFVLGQDIKEAIKRSEPQHQQGYTFSYDMLGEAARTAAHAKQYWQAYSDSIATLAKHCEHADIRNNPGISIKLSALHPRYETVQQQRVIDELVPRVLALAKQARDAGMGLNIDAEEADRLALSLDVIEHVLSDPSLAGWDGFGVVVQAYGKRASGVIHWLYALSEKLDRRIMVRLVKGAYWDSEIKHAQVMGVDGFPVFSKKVATDVSYICCAKQLLDLTDRIYPQFATHNAHTVAAILELARELPTDKTDHFEFQRLHGMGDTLHHCVHEQEKTRCRIYAPVGAHRDLLAYLVRRLLENGANSSFVNQLVDENIAAETIAADPFLALARSRHVASPSIALPKDLFAPRHNSKGWDLNDHNDLEDFSKRREDFKTTQWQAAPILVANTTQATSYEVNNPANNDEVVGSVHDTHPDDVAEACTQAEPWQQSADNRAEVLRLAAQAYEEHAGEIFALLCREAGKTSLDAIGELREAVDFLRYYADQCEQHQSAEPRGIFVCISPWNFPLAIFTGQIAAALAAGNAVLAKPAESTVLISYLAVRLLHRAGVPLSALQLLPGSGHEIGASLVAQKQINGVCFTGSTATAQRINATMADHVEAQAPLIAETGGLNAMIVDSTALPEQAIGDIVVSAFQSAGQRCSALRVLYLQEDIKDTFMSMLRGAMDQLAVDDPWHLATDLGPVIDHKAQQHIQQHIDKAEQQGRLHYQTSKPDQGTFIAPTIIEISAIADLAEEIFGPVLHVVYFAANELDNIINDINQSSYGLTFGMHSRIDDRVELVSHRINAGNIYINRNQIGAIVGSQPFGGEGLSGTGPKAGGPNYLKRMLRPDAINHPRVTASPVDLSAVQKQLDELSKRHISSNSEPLRSQLLPGPTGESNQLNYYGRGVVLCLGPSVDDANAQARIARANGCHGLMVVPDVQGDNAVAGYLTRSSLSQLQGIAAVVLWSDDEDQRAARRALAARDGAIIPLITSSDLAERLLLERHICIDTTASGGNASLLAAVDND